MRIFIYNKNCLALIMENIMSDFANNPIYSIIKLFLSAENMKVAENFSKTIGDIASNSGVDMDSFWKNSAPRIARDLEPGKGKTL